MQLNTSHPLHANLKFLFGVDETNALVDLVTPSRTITRHESSVIGSGAYGRHFGARRSGGTTAYGADISPAFQPANNTGTLLIVTNGIAYAGASINAALISSINNSERLLPRIGYATTGTGMVVNCRDTTSGSNTSSAPTTTPYVGATPRMWAVTRDGETAHTIYVNGVSEVTGGKLGSNGTSGLYSYIGGTPGFATMEADIVWIAWFDKVLTPTEIEDLYSSLGPDNQFALITSGGGGGTAPTGTVTISDVAPGTTSALVTYSYSAGDATGFEYRLGGGAATSIGASPATISGLTAGTPYSIEVRAINAAGAGSWSAAYGFSTAAAGDTTPPTLTGVVSFTDVTQTGYTMSWPAGLDNVAVTGYEYQIGGTAGAWTDAGADLSEPVSGRTPGATETVYVRAYDAAGLRSSPPIAGTVTLLSASTDGTITVGSALYPIKYTSESVLNESGLRATVLDATTLAEVLNMSGVVCSAGVITITDPALVIGNTYHLVVKTAAGWTGISDPVTAS